MASKVPSGLAWGFQMIWQTSLYSLLAMETGNETITIFLLWPLFLYLYSGELIEEWHMWMFGMKPCCAGSGRIMAAWDM